MVEFINSDITNSRKKYMPFLETKKCLFGLGPCKLKHYALGPFLSFLMAFSQVH